MKCEINNDTLKKIQNRTKGVYTLFTQGMIDSKEMKKKIENILSNITKQYEINDKNINEIIPRLMPNERVKDRIFLGNEDFFSADNFKNVVFKRQNNIQSTNIEATTSDNILQGEQVRIRSQINNRFFNQAYGTAVEVRENMIRTSNRELCDCLFINRGFISENIGIVKNDADLNTNIRRYQQLLLTRICDYFRQVIPLTKEGTARYKVDIELLQLINNNELYHFNEDSREFEYTGIFEKLKPYIEREFRLTSDNLTSLYNNGTKIAKSKLQAYNAYVLLNNFDSYIVSILPKTIQISNFNVLTGRDKYSLKRESINISTTWTTEDVATEKEIDNVTKLIVNTTPLKLWQNEYNIEDEYLTYQDYQNVISKIKKFGSSVTAGGIYFNSNFINTYSTLWGSLSQETREYLNNKNLTQVIFLTRQNPRALWHRVFELFSNKDFISVLNQVSQNSIFSIDELNKIWSLQQGIFSDSVNSLRTIIDHEHAIDYYAYITQVGDTISPVTHIQYYIDENGNISIRTLINYNEYKILSQLQTTINTTNSKKVRNWEEDKNKYSIIKNDGVSNIGSNKLMNIIFKLPNSNISIKVYAKTGAVEVRYNDKKINVNDINNIWNDENESAALKDFVESSLNIGIISNTDFWNNFVQISGNAITDIINFASRVMLGRYVSNELLNDKNSIKSNEEILTNATSNDGFKLNTLLNEVNLMHKNDYNTMLRLTTAKVNMLELSMSTTVKDGENKSQQAQSLSSLIGNFYSQVYLYDLMNQKNPTSSMLLLRNGVFEQYFHVKQFFNRSQDVKDVKKMTANEFTQMQLLYDYVVGLMSKQNKNSIIGDGHVLFYPSVNSEKGVIGRILIDLNQKVYTIDDNGKKIECSIKDLSIKQLYGLINSEFGKIYTNICLSIYNDLDNVDTLISEFFDYIGIQYPHDEKGHGLLYSSFVNNYDAFNAFIINNINSIQKLLPDCKTPVDFIRSILLAHNSDNNINLIQLIDNVHYKNLNGNLATNEVLLSQIYRFTGRQGSKYPNSEQFWNGKKIELFRDLIKSNIELNIKNNITKNDRKITDIEIFFNKNKDWIDKSGNIIIAKFKVGDNVYNISSETDILRLGFKSTDEFLERYRKSTYKKSFEIHPEIEKYNALEYLFTQEYTIATVGSFISHPDKSKSNNVLEQEASEFQAQHKRNVAMSSQVHEFSLNQLDGIPSTYNMAVIEDEHDELGTINGTINNVKPYDGATFGNPFVVILENNSLNGARVGVTKKPFVHFYDSRTATSGIVKTAEFGLTNDWIRNSFRLQLLMQKMTDRVWLNQNGTPFVTNILVDYNGKNINYFDNKSKSTDMYFKRGAKFYKITNIINNGNNNYTRQIQECDERGNIIGTNTIDEQFEVNSNYKLWQLFGGANSLSLVNTHLQWSNVSVEHVVTAMNNIGIKLNGNVKTQDDLYQPLKHSDIHWLATAGAVKQGAANINSRLRYTDDMPLDCMKIGMYQAGVSLNKEHSVDDAELSLMTQIVNACSLLGYTSQDGTNLLNGLQKAVQNGIKEHITAFNKFIKGDTQALTENVYKSVLKVIANEQNPNTLIAAIAQDVIDAAKSGKEINFAETSIPLSDSAIYSKIVSLISSMMNSKAIKLKISGILSVLTPSHGIMKLYDGKKLEEFDNFDTELNEAQQKANENPIFNLQQNINRKYDIDLGKQYFVTRRKSINGVVTTETTSELIRTPKDYYRLSEEIESGTVDSIVEDVKAGRELGGYNIRFSDIDGNQYCLWDLDSVRDIFTLNDIIKERSFEKLQNFITKFNLNYNITNENFDNFAKIALNRARRVLQANLNSLNKDLQNPIRYCREFFEINGTNFDQQKCDDFIRTVNIILGTQNDNTIQIDGEQIRITPANIKSYFKRIIDIVNDFQKISINGKSVIVNKNDITINPYELIMSKKFSTVFGLTEFTSLNEIVNDKEYFLKRYIENNATKTSKNNFTVELKRSNGNHIYILSKKNLDNTENLHKLENIEIYTDEDGFTFRVDQDGNIMYQIFDGTEIWADENGTEIIVDDDISRFIGEIPSDTIYFSESLIQDNADEIEKILFVAEPFYPEFCKRINYLKRQTGTQLTVNAILTDNANNRQIIENYRKNGIFDKNSYLYKMAMEKHSSFLKSLEVVCGRIPAQSLQSFMPMKIVAFDNPNINTAYVSTYQLLFQGSDYDIDSVSIAMYDINRSGTLDLWSPYANTESIELLNASMNIPLPNGQYININEMSTAESEEDRVAVGNFFSQYAGKLFNIVPVYENGDISTTEIDLDLRLDSVEKINLFINFLEDINKLKKLNEKDKRILSVQLFNNEQTIGILSDNQIDILYSKIINVANNHNTYLQQARDSKYNRIIGNYIIKSMYNVAINPSNLMESQAAMDAVTSKIKNYTKKSIIEQELKQRTPGNFVNKILSLRENRVGQDSLAITAIAMKTFEGLTQYYNDVLNNGDEEAQKRLLFNRKIGEKAYKILANVRALNPNTIKNSEVRKILANLSYDNDIALDLSALISLAADNAKELELAKLNCNVHTTGMYAYGISIGMEFNKLADIINSEVGYVICNLMDSNVFSNYKGIFNVNTIQKYFSKDEKYGPTVYNEMFYRAQNIIQKFTKLVGMFSTKHIITAKNFAHYLSEEVYKSIVTEKGKNKNIKYYLDICQKIKEEAQTQDEIRCINCIEEYIKNAYVIYDNSATYFKFIELAKGADEMRRLGSILSLNQGLKTNTINLIRQVALIEDSVYNAYLQNKNDPRYQTKSQKHENLLVDISKFVFDEQYRNEVIKKYDNYKHTFNILDVIAHNSHTMEYIKTLAITHNELMKTYKYRTIYDILKNRTINKKNSVKILKCINDNIVNTYLENKYFFIPRGNKIIDADGNTYILKEDTKIRLGTVDGNATFRMFIENVIIPNSKKGIITENQQDVSIIKNNKFISDLVSDVSTNTVLGNPTMIYTLPISMLPKSKNEELILNKYISEFNKLSNESYNYSIEYKTSNGIKTELQSIPLTDLFVLYSMVSGQYEINEKSLVPMFQNIQNTGILKEFHDFEVNVDQGNVKVNVSKNLDMYIADFGNIYTDVGPTYVKHFNRMKHEIELYKKERQTNEYQESELYEMIGDFEFVHQLPLYKKVEINHNGLKQTFKTVKGENDSYIQAEIKESNGQRHSFSIDNNGNIFKIDGLKPGKFDIYKKNMKKYLGFGLINTINEKGETVRVPNFTILEALMQDINNKCGE